MPAEETAIEAWVLTLAIREGTHLLAFLSDGRWQCTVGEAAWPPQRLPALPGVVLEGLTRLGEARLSIQLPVELDAWPWEDEIDAAVVRQRPIARHLTGLLHGASPALFSRLVVWEDGADDRAAAIRSAGAAARPVVVARGDIPAAKRPMLENLLRSHWRHPMLLSQSLERSLRILELPLASCRLYGDDRGAVDDAEEGWRPVTAVSIDLVGSTPLLNARKGEEYGETMNAYYRVCREITLRFYGTLDSPQGDDGLMAYFGFPRAVEGAASRALTAAWHLSHALSEQGLPVRIGVASGEVAVNARLAYGPDVHLAARIRARARPGQVLVAPSTLLRVSAGFGLELHAADQTLDGFDLPMSLYSLTGLPASRSADDAPLAPSTRFIGRRVELARLDHVWNEATAGRLGWCVVRGEPGVGKSRLLQEFSRVVRRQGRSCYQVTGQALADRSPFAAVVDALRQLWRIVPGADADALAEQLKQLPLPTRAADDPAIGELVRLLIPSPWVGAAPEPDTRWRSAEPLLDCMKAVLCAGPCCLVVDDAQWLDPSSVELLGRLQELDASQPLLIVLGERSESAPVLRIADAQVVDLEGLSADEAAELALELGAGLPPWARQRVVERAGGLPLFLEESMRMLRERGVQAVDDLPAKLEDLLVTRLDELGLDRAFAQLVSVLGRDCLAVHLEMLLQQDDPFVVAARRQGSLEFLLEAGLLQYLDGPRPGYRFRHGLIRDAAYRSMRSKDRQRLHGLCATLLEQVTPEIRRERPELLAAHLQAAGRTVEAREAWHAAARLAAARHAHRETVALSRRALELVETVDDPVARGRLAVSLHMLVASAQIALHGYGSQEVEQAYLLAEASATVGADTARRLRIRLGLEACHVMRGNLARAGAFATEAILATEGLQDARLALQARWALANVHFHRGRWRASLAGFDDCIARYHRGLHQRSSVQDPAIMCLGYSSWIHFELGEANEALRRIDRMLALARELDHPFNTGVTLAFAASIKRLCGDGEAAWLHAVEAVDVCERGGFEVWLAHAWMVRGQLSSDRGDERRGADDMDRGYALWTAGGARISCATYLVTRAEILLRQQRIDAAATHLAAAEQVSRNIGEAYYRAELRRLQGLLAWQAGDLSLAETTLQRALVLARRHAKKGLALRCAVSLGALEAATGRPQGAATRLRGCIDGLTDHDRCRDLRWAQSALSHWETGRSFAALAHTPWEPA